jgi:membrane-bound serine protease (ClpP class)
MNAPNPPTSASRAARGIRTIATPFAVARRLTSLLLVALVAAGAFTLAGSAPAHAAQAAGARLDIVKVSGLIDPINADLVSRSLRTAANDHALALVLELNSTGGTISAASRDALAERLVRSPVPIAVWVGGTGSPRALGTAFTLLRGADFTGEAPGSKVGNGPPPPQTVADGLEHRTMSGDDAVDARLLNAAAPTLVSFLGDLSGRTIKGVHIDLGQANHGFRKDLTFNFSELSVLPKLLHSAATPDVAFVMLLIAMALALFEFFTVGIGIAAATGVLFLVPASYGLGVLPVHPWAIVLLAVAFIGFAIDLQAGAPRFWTAVGGASYVVGALALYQGRRVSLWVIVLMGLLLAFFVLTGMPAMVRSRFSTPTIGRQSLIGRMGVAESGVDPEGTVRVDGAPWRARTNRATPIPAGELVRVVAIDGLLLEVEPETGGAREAHH